MEDQQPERQSVSAHEKWCWAPLWLLCVGLFVGALTFDPGEWPSVVGDESTYLMAAQSLAFDADYRYTSGDRERFFEIYGKQPEGLILQSADGGESLIFGKPVPYPLFVAPLTRILPRNGHAVANSLLLVSLALFAAVSLRRRWGPLAPLAVALLTFGSVAFAHVFWAHSDLFQMCLVGGALLLLFAPLERLSESPWRGLIAGMLLGPVVLMRPVYAVVLVVLLALPDRRLALRTAGAVAAIFGLLVLSNLVVRGNWTSYGGERLAYYSYTGFPDGSAASWQERIAARGPNSWTGSNALPFGFDPIQSAWNVVYLLTGRHVGLLAYFAPALLAAWGWRNNRLSLMLLVAGAGVALAFLVLRPFNFWGGGGALANRYLLPVYPVAWLLIQKPIRWPSLAAVTVVASLFLWPTWRSPRAFYRADDGAYHHVSAVAERVLPYETTQSHLKPSGAEDFLHLGEDDSAVWVKPLGPEVRQDGDRRIEVRAGRHPAKLLLASEERLSGVRLLDSETGRPLGELPTSFSSRHRMWWGDGPLRLYQVDFGPLLRELGVGYLNVALEPNSDS